MKKIKLFILTIISLMIISVFSLTYATNAMSQGVNDVENGARNIGNDIKNGVSDIGTGISSTVSDIGSGVSNGVNNLGSDIRSGIDNNTDTNGATNSGNTTDRNNTMTGDTMTGTTTGNGANSNTANTNNDTNTATNPDVIRDGTYSTQRVAYTDDNVNFLGMTMSKTSVTLLIVALAAIIVAILVFSYVSQDNDRYRDNS